MAFNYDPTTDIGKTRLEIGDTDFGAGVKPSGKNFTDAEIQLLLTREGTWGRAAAAACEILARHWSRIPDSASTGSKIAGGRSRSNQQVAHFRDAAKELRQLHGGGNNGAFSADFLRDDGFHKSNEFDDSGDEYNANAPIYIRPGG